MVGVNLNAILRGVALFMVAYLLFVMETPILDSISDATASFGYDNSFNNTLHTLCDYFCLILGGASILYILLAGLFSEEVMYEGPRYY